MIQPFQNQSRQVSSFQNPSRQMNQVEQYQNNDNQMMMMSPFGNDPFFSEFQNMHTRMMQNFQNMTQMMNSGNPFQGSSMLSQINPEFNEDDIFSFSNMNNQLISGGNAMSNGNGQFQVFSRSMVQKQVMGADGQPKLEKYYNDNMIARGDDGNTISEKKQAYHNQGSGRSLIAHERMLNDQGHKYIKERNQHGEISDQNLYHNIEEEQAQQFHDRWTNQRNAIRSIASNEPTRYMQIQHQPSTQTQYQRPQLQQQQQSSSSQRQPLTYVSERPTTQYRQQERIATPNYSQTSNSRPLSGYSERSMNDQQRYIPSYTQQQRIQTPQSLSQAYRLNQQTYPVESKYPSYNQY